MKKFSILALSFVIAACFPAIAFADNFRADNSELSSADPVDQTEGVYSNPATLIALNFGMNGNSPSDQFDPVRETPSGRISDGLNLGAAPLFITGSIRSGQSSVPESSMMLLLGIGLIGLAGYGGRKKFKR